MSVGSLQSSVPSVLCQVMHCTSALSEIALPEQACMQSVGYQAARSRPCSTFQCFSAADCTNHGSCNSTTSACACSAGYTGPSCNIFLGPCAPASPTPSPQPAASSSATFCCATGVVDYVGKCCQSGNLWCLAICRLQAKMPTYCKDKIEHSSLLYHSRGEHHLPSLASCFLPEISDFTPCAPCSKILHLIKGEVCAAN